MIPNENMIIKDISDKKNDVVKNIVRAFEQTYGRIHIFDIVCDVNGINDLNNCIFDGFDIPPFVAELNANDSRNSFRCTLDSKGQITLPGTVINTQTRISVFGIVIY